MIFKKVSFNGGKTFFIAPTWDQLGHLCFKLAKLINQAGKKYDKIVVIAKGGLTWSRVLADYIQVGDIEAIRVKLYRGIGKAFKKPQVIQEIKSDIEGEDILLFDDVADSGQTLEFVKKLLAKKGAKSVDTATLFYKPSSKSTPDFFDHQTDAWIIFPHEIREFIEETSKDWMGKGLSKKQVASRFLRLGLPEDQVVYFLNLQ
jgi:hypoxanthine phosphoribosyltransferase